LLEVATTPLGPGPLRSDVLALLSELVAGDAEGGEKRRALIEQSLREAGQDARRRAEALLRLDIWERSQDRLADALEAARAAVALAEEVDDEYLLARALTRQVDLEVLLGLAKDPPAHFRRALELDQKLRIDPYLGPRSMLAVCLVRAGRVDEARPLLLLQHARALDEGNEDARTWLCLFLAELEWLAGRWSDSAGWLREGLELAEQCEARLQYGALLSVLAIVEASRGDVDAARVHANEGLQLCESIVEVAYALQNRYALGFLELSLGHVGAAHEHLAGFGFDRGIEGTKRLSFIGDAIEALVRLGEVERAAELVDELERRGHQLHRKTLLGVAMRCRGLLRASEGDTEAAAGLLESAVEIFDSLNLPFERSRTLLVLGEVLRRGKQKREARARLDEALAVFEALGANLWVEKARAELARISGRAATGGLTPTEQRVAGLVAEGRSNKEVAAALFVTVKTVERTLSRIYEKLGVRSRAELARRFATN
jgi:DNA-binding CsgD family transcriptional regulator